MSVCAFYFVCWPETDSVFGKTITLNSAYLWSVKQCQLIILLKFVSQANSSSVSSPVYMRIAFHIYGAIAGTQGRTGGNNSTIPRATNDCKVRQKIPSTFLIQYIRSRNTSGSNMGQTCFSPRAPSNLVTPPQELLAMQLNTCQVRLRHRRSQGVTGPCSPKLFRTYVILCLERRYPKQNCAIRLKSNILPPHFWAGYATGLRYSKWTVKDPTKL